MLSSVFLAPELGEIPVIKTKCACVCFASSGWPLAQPRELPAHAFVASDEESGTETTQTSATGHASSDRENRALLNLAARSSGVAIRAPRGVSRGKRRVARGGAR